MMCAKFGIIVIANNDLAMGGGTYETPYRLHFQLMLRNLTPLLTSDLLKFAV